MAEFPIPNSGFHFGLSRRFDNKFFNSGIFAFPKAVLIYLCCFSDICAQDFGEELAELGDIFWRLCIMAALKVYEDWHRAFYNDVLSRPCKFLFCYAKLIQMIALVEDFAEKRFWNVADLS